MKYFLIPEWQKIVSTAFTEEYKRSLFTFVENEYSNNSCFPDKQNIFNALNLTPPNGVKVVIIGQDPYHTPNQADGLCFSCADGNPQPSLKNIFKEMANDVGCPMPKKYTLDGWARQGVLLLNTILTVRQGTPSAHAGHGWEEFTTFIIKYLAQQSRPIVFILWGGYARKFAPLIIQSQHLVLEAVHPSPLSAYGGFFGCKHFSKCNNFLQEHGIVPIEWDKN